MEQLITCAVAAHGCTAEAFIHEALQAEAFAEPNAGTLSLLPNFHVIGFTNNFLFTLLAGVRCVVQADAGGAALSAAAAATMASCASRACRCASITDASVPVATSASHPA